MDIRLDGRRALVTGGNSGIGEAIVEALAEAGSRVAINYVAHPEDAESLAKRIRDGGGDALAVEAVMRHIALQRCDGWRPSSRVRA